MSGTRKIVRKRSSTITTTTTPQLRNPRISTPQSRDLRISTPQSRDSRIPTFTGGTPRTSTSQFARSSVPMGATPRTTKTTSSKTTVDPSGRKHTISTTKTTTQLPSRRLSNIPKPETYKSSSALPKNILDPSRSSLEQLVNKELQFNASMRPGSPQISAKGSKRKITTPPIIQSPRGPVRGTHQVTLQQTLHRSANSEFINRRMTGIETDQDGQAHQIELNIQNMEGMELPPEEVVVTTSSVTIGPGIKAQVHSALYETTEHSKRDKHLEGTKMSTCAINPTDLEKMIDAEIQEIERTSKMEPPELISPEPSNYPLKRKIQKLRLTQETVKKLENSIINPPPVTADEVHDEMQPEFIAALMHTEEKGLTMGSPPTNVYNYLFPDARDEYVMEVSAAAPAPLEKIVIPNSLPVELHSTAVTKQMQHVIEHSFGHDKEPPANDIYAQSVLKSGTLPKPNNISVKGKKKKRSSKEQYTPLMAEEPPWGPEDIQSMIDLIGAHPTSKLGMFNDVSEIPPDSSVLNETDMSLEYPVLPAAPQHVSRVQLRGSQKPPWFPGYYCALPEDIKIVRSPSEVLKSAWQAVQPNIFADDTFLVVD